jgi:hypothetical protein
MKGKDMSVYETAKEALKLVDKAANLELYQKLVDLQAQAVEQSGQILEQAKTIEEKDKRIEQLEDALTMKGNMKCQHSAYWHINESGNILDGPYCSKCWDIDHLLCRLVQAPTFPSGAGHSWEWIQCQKCKAPFRSSKAGQYINTH